MVRKYAMRGVLWNANGVTLRTGTGFVEVVDLHCVLSHQRLMSCQPIFFDPLMMRRGTEVTQGNEVIHEPWPGQDPPKGDQMYSKSMVMFLNRLERVRGEREEQEVRTCGR